MNPASPNYRRNVAAVIMDAGGNVLVGKKKQSSRFIHFPQGGVKKKETFEAALWREITEETGLPLAGLKIVARLAGLSYDYRRKNRKREKWAGQEQTYYLIRCEGVCPPVPEPPGSEFGVLEWMPAQTLTPELFVSFKRPVVAEVLKAFFPTDMKDCDAHILSLNTLTRYRFTADSSLSDFSPADRAFYAGGKDEALSQMADLQARICAAQQRLTGKKVLILLFDADNYHAKRRTNCLRRISSLFDPLLTRVEKPQDMATITRGGRHVLPALTHCVPPDDETLIVSESAYSMFATLSDTQLDNIATYEQLMTDDAITVLKFFLHITAEQRAKVADDYTEYLQTAQSVLQATASPVPWHIIPAEKKWYRDYVIASIVAQTLENLAASV